jgi:hypothetical protein
MTRPVASIEKTGTNPDVQGHLGELVKKLQKRTGELVVAGLMTLANWISSPSMAQEVPRVVWAGQESTRILQAWEIPKSVFVTPGGKHTDQWPKYSVTTSVSTSASAAVDKGVGVLQYTKDGREFGKLSDDEVGKLDIRDAEKYLTWIERKAYEQKQKTINEEQRLTENREKVIKTAQAADKEGEKVISEEQRLTENREEVISEYKKMITNFAQLHANKSAAPIYFTIKGDLKKVLLSGKPPEILPQLEPLRSILMS